MGRDIDDVEYAMQYEERTWEIVGDADDYRQTQERIEIMEAMKGRSDPISPSDLADLLQKDRSNVNHMLLKMERDGYVRKVGYGKYVYI